MNEKQPDTGPLLNQALQGFFHLPWPRKPINKPHGKGQGQGHGKSAGPRTGRTGHRRNLSQLY